MNNELVNAVQCAKIITEDFNRKVDRSYITRLANNGKVPYTLVDDKKMFNPMSVLDCLPKERLTSSKFDVEVNQLVIIEELKKGGLKVNFNKQRPKKDFSSNETLSKQLPFIEEYTIDDIKKEVIKRKYPKEELQLITDELIKKEIEKHKVCYNTLNNLWQYNELWESDYISNHDKETNYFFKKQQLMFFYIIMQQFPILYALTDAIYEEATIS